MKRILITRLCSLLLLYKVFTSCSDKKIDCNNFKTGKFVFHNAFTGTDILITRSDSLQTSVDKKTGIGNKCRIEWTGSCEFKLRFLAFIMNGKDSVFENFKSATATTVIIKGTKDYYISDTKLDGEQGVHTDTAWVTGE